MKLKSINMPSFLYDKWVSAKLNKESPENDILFTDIWTLSSC